MIVLFNPVDTQQLPFDYTKYIKNIMGHMPTYHLRCRMYLMSYMSLYGAIIQAFRAAGVLSVNRFFVLIKKKKVQTF